MKRHTYKKGAVFMYVVVLLTVITSAIAVGFTQPNIREFKNAVRENLSNNAFVLAEAGNEDAFYRLKFGMNTPATIEIELNGSVATTTLTTVGDTTEITSASAVERHTRTSQLVVSDTSTPVGGIDYAAHVGAWGIELDSNVEIRGVAPEVGEIYANGEIRGAKNGSIITGDAYSASDRIEDTQASSVSCVTDQDVGQSNPEVDHAQSFVATTSSSVLNSVEMYIRKQGNPQSKTVHIVADNGGVPDTTILSSGTLDRNKVSSIYSWVKTTLSPSITLTPGNTYWIVFDTDRQPSKYYQWCRDLGDPYAAGASGHTQDMTSPSWSIISGDLAFKVFYGEGDSRIFGIDDLQGDAYADEIIDSTISGDAYYQFISGSAVAGSEYASSPTPTVLPLPLTDTQINSWIAAAQAGGTIPGDCPADPACGLSMGPIEIDGDLELLGGDTLTVTGTIYVTGNLLTDNNSTIECDVAYGSDSCTIITEGYMDFRNNTVFQGSGSPGSFIMLITRKEDCLITSGSGCGPSNSALYHNNNGATGGVFFAQDSVAFLENNTTASSIVARGVKLSNNALLIYDADLRNLEVGTGSGVGGGGGWLVDDWREVE